jgi:hypothetical protein
MEEYKGLEITIEQDIDPTDPRESDNIGTMVCFHNRYNLGDTNHGFDNAETAQKDLAMELDKNVEDQIDYWENEGYWKAREDLSNDHDRAASYIDSKIDKIVEKAIEKNAYVLPLYLYDHSGITMNTGGFSCPWDSGQVGFIYARKDYADKETPDPMKCLEGEVKEYDQYISGEVYGFVIEDPEGHVDEESCWGFFGYDYCLEEAERTADYMYKEKIKAKCLNMIDTGKASLLKLRHFNLLNAITTA